MREIYIALSVVVLLVAVACGEESASTMMREALAPQGAPRVVADGDALPVPGTYLTEASESLLRPDYNWDAGPPDTESATFHVACGLSTGPFSIVLLRDGDGWKLKKGPGPSIQPDVMAACMADVDSPVTWDADGGIGFTTGAWLHSVGPSGMPGTWRGYVSRDDRSAACDAALAAHFIPYPVPLALTRETP